MKGTMILTMGLIAMVALAGCGASNPAGPGVQAGGFVIPAPKEVSQENSLIGVWQMQGGSGPPPLIRFKNGVEVEVTETVGYETPLTVSGAYVVNGNTLFLMAGEEAEPPILERFTTYTYAIDGNTLTLTDAHGATRWVKM